MKNIGTPVNYMERLQYEQLIRLDALCNMLSSLIGYIEQEQSATVENVTHEEIYVDEPNVKHMPNYEAYTVKELKEMCKNADIDGYSNMKKDELISALKEV